MTEHLSQFIGAPVYRTILSNGLTIITANTGSTLARVDVVFRIGAIDDGPRPGMAHMLEHLVCNSDTPDGIHPLVRSLEIGGSYTNASTSFLATGYYIDGFKENLLPSIQALMKMTFDAEISARSLEAERGPVCAEIRMRESGGRFARWIHRTLAPAFPELHESVSGTEDAVRAMTVEELHAHYARYYGTRNAALIVTGGVEHETVVETVERACLPGTGTPPVRREVQPVLGRFTYVDPDLSSGLEMYFASKAEEQDSFLLDLGMGVLARTHFSPVIQRLRYKDRLIYHAWAGIVEDLVKRPYIDIAVAAEHFDYTERVLTELVEDLKHGRFSEEAWLAHINDERRSTLSGREFFEGKSGYDDWSRTLTECWVENDWHVIDYLALLDNVTKDQVQETAQRFLDLNSYGLLIINRPD